MASVTVYVGKELTRGNYNLLLGFTPDFVFPESDLHPTKQAEWALAFVRAVELGGDIKVVTHSDAILCSLCDGVYHKRLTSSQIKIVIVNADGTRNEYGVDDDGYLLPGWPFGYMNWCLPYHVWSSDVR